MSYSNVKSLDFSSAVRDWTEKTKEDIETVFHMATKEVAATMQKIGPSTGYPGGQGGAMPVMTGHLRSSVEVSLTSLPMVNPESYPPQGTPLRSIPYDRDALNALIESAKLGDTIYIGYTAAYAGYQDVIRHFVDFGSMSWPNIVEREAMMVFQ